MLIGTKRNDYIYIKRPNIVETLVILCCSREETVFDNSTVTTDPYDNGIDVVDLESGHLRSRRSVWDGLKFRLEAPSVDWRKFIGTSAIGASFGLIMMNLLDLQIGNYIFFVMRYPEVKY